MESPIQNAEPANTNQMPATPVEQGEQGGAPGTEQVTAQVTAQAPQPEQAPEPTPQPEPKPEPVVYEPTGNKALDSAAKIVADNGFDPVALSQEMRDNGRLTDDTRAKLVDKLGEAQVDILSSTYEVEVSKAQQAATQKAQAVYDTVGSKETWDQIAAWTATDESGLTEEAADEYNNMLAAGGVQAQLAARALKEAYMSSPGFKQDNPTMQQPTSNVPAAPTFEPISRPQYTQERKKAVREGNAAVVEQLDARARHTMDKLPNQWRINAVIN